MPYIGNTIRAADDYRLIDDISSSFNGSTTSFALQVAGSAPVPFPKSPQQVLISVNGVIQEPDPSGSSGFNLVGTNIVFSSAPTNGHAFFGIIYATADYLNAGGNFPAGSLGAPSITFIGDENTGLYRKGGGSIGFVADATEIANTDSNGLTISSGNLILGDSSGANDDRIKLGASGDLEIYHDGSHSRIVDGGTGGLKIQSDALAIDNAAGTETMAAFTQDGAVQLRHNNSTKFETSSTGITITGDANWNDNGKAEFGNAADLQIYHDGTDSYLDNSTGNLNIRVAGTEKGIRVTPNGSVNLYHNDVQKLNTASGGVEISGTCTATSFSGSGANLTGINTDLVSDTSPQLGGDLDANGHNIAVDGGNNITIGDSGRLRLGNSNDLDIYHHNTNSFIENTEGALYISTVAGSVEINKSSAENMAKFIVDGAVELYHDNSKKFETTANGFITQNSGQSTILIGSTGANGARIILDGDSNGDGAGGDFATIEHDTTGNLHIRTDNPAHGCSMAFSTNGTIRTIIDSDGTLRPFANNTNDLGSNSVRWRNIYTNDLNLSNEGSFNDVDSTWGDYTIQEGFEDLYLINNRTGKKFKFNLTEVS